MAAPRTGAFAPHPGKPCMRPLLRPLARSVALALALFALSGGAHADSPAPPPPAAAPPCACADKAGENARSPVTIIVSIDGFRADYLDRGVTPALSRLAAEGVRARMIPSFPSKTFPNHEAIATGLRPDRSGIVGNRMVDARRPGDVFTMATQDPWWWEESTPIWVAAEKAGIATATMFWPGANLRVLGTYPTDWQQFSKDITSRQRIDAVIDWARRPAANRPKLLVAYLETVDAAGHAYGPDAPETTQAIADVDVQIGRLRDALAAMGQPANLLVVSDHGMAAIAPERAVPLYKRLAPGLAEVVEDGPYATINPLPGQDAALAAVLLAPQAHMQCRRKADLPERLHYGHNARVPAFVCLADMGWIIQGDAPKADAAPVHGGTHGWDNQAPEMRALFLATGPAFRPGTTLPDFDNVDVEPLLRRLIGLPAHDAAIDGTAAVFAPALAR